MLTFTRRFSFIRDHIVLPVLGTPLPILALLVSHSFPLILAIAVYFFAGYHNLALYNLEASQNPFEEPDRMLDAIPAVLWVALLATAVATAVYVALGECRPGLLRSAMAFTLYGTFVWTLVMWWRIFVLILGVLLDSYFFGAIEHDSIDHIARFNTTLFALAVSVIIYLLLEVHQLWARAHWYRSPRHKPMVHQPVHEQSITRWTDFYVHNVDQIETAAVQTPPTPPEGCMWWSQGDLREGSGQFRLPLSQSVVSTTTLDTFVQPVPLALAPTFANTVLPQTNDTCERDTLPEDRTTEGADVADVVETSCLGRLARCIRGSGSIFEDIIYDKKWFEGIQGDLNRQIMHPPLIRDTMRSPFWPVRNLTRGLALGHTRDMSGSFTTAQPFPSIVSTWFLFSMIFLTSFIILLAYDDKLDPYKFHSRYISEITPVLYPHLYPMYFVDASGNTSDSIVGSTLVTTLVQFTNKARREKLVLRVMCLIIGSIPILANFVLSIFQMLVAWRSQCSFMLRQACRAVPSRWALILDRCVHKTLYGFGASTLVQQSSVILVLAWVFMMCVNIGQFRIAPTMVADASVILTFSLFKLALLPIVYFMILVHWSWSVSLRSTLFSNITAFAGDISMALNRLSLLDSRDSHNQDSMLTPQKAHGQSRIPHVQQTMVLRQCIRLYPETIAIGFNFFAPHVRIHAFTQMAEFMITGSVHRQPMIPFSRESTQTDTPLGIAQMQFTESCFAATQQVSPFGKDTSGHFNDPIMLSKPLVVSTIDRQDRSIMTAAAVAVSNLMYAYYDIGMLTAVQMLALTFLRRDSAGDLGVTSGANQEHLLAMAFTLRSAEIKGLLEYFLDEALSPGVFAAPLAIRATAPLYEYPSAGERREFPQMTAPLSRFSLDPPYLLIPVRDRYNLHTTLCRLHSIYTILYRIKTFKHLCNASLLTNDVYLPLMDSQLQPGRHSGSRNISTAFTDRSLRTDSNDTAYWHNEHLLSTEMRYQRASAIASIAPAMEAAVNTLTMAATRLVDQLEESHPFSQCEVALQRCILAEINNRPVEDSYAQAADRLTSSLHAAMGEALQLYSSFICVPTERIIQEPMLTSSDTLRQLALAVISEHTPFRHAEGLRTQSGQDDDACRPFCENTSDIYLTSSTGNAGEHEDIFAYSVQTDYSSARENSPTELTNATARFGSVGFSSAARPVGKITPGMSPWQIKMPHLPFVFRQRMLYPEKTGYPSLDHPRHTNFSPELSVGYQAAAVIVADSLLQATVFIRRVRWVSIVAFVALAFFVSHAMLHHSIVRDDQRYNLFAFSAGMQNASASMFSFYIGMNTFRNASSPLYSFYERKQVFPPARPNLAVIRLGAKNESFSSFTVFPTYSKFNGFRGITDTPTWMNDDSDTKNIKIPISMGMDITNHFLLLFRRLSPTSVSSISSLTGSEQRAFYPVATGLIMDQQIYFTKEMDAYEGGSSHSIEFGVHTIPMKVFAYLRNTISADTTAERVQSFINAADLYAQYVHTRPSLIAGISDYVFSEQESITAMLVLVVIGGCFIIFIIACAYTVSFRVSVLQECATIVIAARSELSSAWHCNDRQHHLVESTHCTQLLEADADMLASEQHHLLGIMFAGKLRSDTARFEMQLDAMNPVNYAMRHLLVNDPNDRALACITSVLLHGMPFCYMWLDLQSRKAVHNFILAWAEQVSNLGHLPVGKISIYRPVSIHNSMLPASNDIEYKAAPYGYSSVPTVWRQFRDSIAMNSLVRLPRRIDVPSREQSTRPASLQRTMSLPVLPNRKEAPNQPLFPSIQQYKQGAVPERELLISTTSSAPSSLSHTSSLAEYSSHNDDTQDSSTVSYSDTTGLNDPTFDTQFTALELFESSSTLTPTVTQEDEPIANDEPHTQTKLMMISECESVVSSEPVFKPTVSPPAKDPHLVERESVATNLDDLVERSKGIATALDADEHVMESCSMLFHQLHDVVTGELPSKNNYDDPRKASEVYKQPISRISILKRSKLLLWLTLLILFAVLGSLYYKVCDLNSLLTLLYRAEKDIQKVNQVTSQLVIQSSMATVASLEILAMYSSFLSQDVSSIDYALFAIHRRQLDIITQFVTETAALPSVIPAVESDLMEGFSRLLGESMRHASLLLDRISRLTQANMQTGVTELVIDENKMRELLKMSDYFSVDPTADSLSQRRRLNRATQLLLIQPSLVLYERNVHQEMISPVFMDYLMHKPSPLVVQASAASMMLDSLMDPVVTGTDEQIAAFTKYRRYSGSKKFMRTLEPMFPTPTGSVMHQIGVSGIVPHIKDDSEQSYMDAAVQFFKPHESYRENERAEYLQSFSEGPNMAIVHEASILDMRARSLYAKMATKVSRAIIDLINYMEALTFIITVVIVVATGFIAIRRRLLVRKIVPWATLAICFGSIILTVVVGSLIAYLFQQPLISKLDYIGNSAPNMPIQITNISDKERKSPLGQTLTVTHLFCCQSAFLRLVDAVLAFNPRYIGEYGNSLPAAHNVYHVLNERLGEILKIRNEHLLAMTISYPELMHHALDTTDECTRAGYTPCMNFDKPVLQWAKLFRGPTNIQDTNMYDRQNPSDVGIDWSVVLQPSYLQTRESDRPLAYSYPVTAHLHNNSWQFYYSTQSTHSNYVMSVRGNHIPGFTDNGVNGFLSGINEATSYSKIRYYANHPEIPFPHYETPTLLRSVPVGPTNTTTTSGVSHPFTDATEHHSRRFALLVYAWDVYFGVIGRVLGLLDYASPEIKAHLDMFNELNKWKVTSYDPLTDWETSGICPCSHETQFDRLEMKVSCACPIPDFAYTTPRSSDYMKSIRGLISLPQFSDAYEIIVESLTSWPFHSFVTDRHPAPVSPQELRKAAWRALMDPAVSNKEIFGVIRDAKYISYLNNLVLSDTLPGALEAGKRVGAVVMPCHVVHLLFNDSSLPDQNIVLLQTLILVTLLLVLLLLVVFVGLSVCKIVSRSQSLDKLRTMKPYTSSFHTPLILCLTRDRRPISLFSERRFSVRRYNKLMTTVCIIFLTIVLCIASVFTLSFAVNGATVAAAHMKHRYPARISSEVVDRLSVTQLGVAFDVNRALSNTFFIGAPMTYLMNGALSMTDNLGLQHSIPKSFEGGFGAEISKKSMLNYYSTWYVTYGRLYTKSIKFRDLGTRINPRLELSRVFTPSHVMPHMFQSSLSVIHEPQYVKKSSKRQHFSRNSDDSQYYLPLHRSWAQIVTRNDSFGLHVNDNTRLVLWKAHLMALSNLSLESEGNLLELVVYVLLLIVSSCAIFAVIPIIHITLRSDFAEMNVVKSLLN